ncbi:hypothetical protein GCM10028819_38960 [Spirosoma humi]
MIDNNITVGEGQVFQPYPENPNELIRYNSGRWLHSADSGKTYSYRADMQERNKADALSPKSVCIIKTHEERFSIGRNKEIEASYQAYLEDKERPLYERHRFNIRDGLIIANESAIEDDIDDSLKAFVDGRPLEIEWLAMTIRMLLRDYRIDNPEFDLVAFIEDVKAKVTDRADALSITYPAFQAKFTHGAAVSLKKRLTKILAEFTSSDIPTPNLPTSTSNTITEGARSGVASTPYELQPNLYVPDQMQTRLFKTLSIYTPTEQHGALGELLEKGYSNDRIWVKLRADSLAYIFKVAREARTNPILADMKELANWLAAYISWGKKNPKPVSYDYAYKVLRGNETVETSNQIRLKQ